MDNLTLETLSKYQLKTLNMLNHIDKMLIAYEWNCSRRSFEAKRSFKILKRRYLVEVILTVKEMSELYNVEQSTVYRDTKIAIKNVSIILFGTDAIDLKNVKKAMTKRDIPIA